MSASCGRTQECNESLQSHRVCPDLVDQVEALVAAVRRSYDPPQLDGVEPHALTLQFLHVLVSGDECLGELARTERAIEVPEALDDLVSEGFVEFGNGVDGAFRQCAEARCERTEPRCQCGLFDREGAAKGGC